MGFHKAGWTYVEQSAGIMENVADGLQRPQPFFAILSWTRGSHSFDRETGALCEVALATAPPQRHPGRLRALREAEPDSSQPRGPSPGQRHWPCPDRGDRSAEELKSGVLIRGD